MALKQAVLGKRKASPTQQAAASTSEGPQKKSHTEGESQTQQSAIVQREFYPPEMSVSRAMAYRDGSLPRPGDLLNAALRETRDAREKIPVKDAVVHWFKMDLRLQDNTALHAAAQKAKDAGVPLIGVFLVSPQDYQAHLRAPVRIDFTLRTLAVLRDDLAKLDIPLHIETVLERNELPDRLLELAESWGASHIYANIEYEVDELRRETRLVRKCLDHSVAFHALHDACVVAPGKLSSQQGNQYAVYSPWLRAWIAHCHANAEALTLFEPPGPNPASARTKFKHLFDEQVPEAPENKRLTKEEKTRFHSLWREGEHEAVDRLTKFLDEKIGEYRDSRNFPEQNGTAMLSVHFAAGTLSARTAVRRARDANSAKKLDGGNPGIACWISEVAWRDFYKHVLANWPYVCMNTPFKPEYANIEWEYSTSHFQAWCEGRTGYPIVDAAMRQMNELGYMHNRCRMIVASFLAKDLLLDWRMGERYFMEHLIDGDFASNNGGWGFSASTGVDPQPYFRIFNPTLQSERFDPDGAYIRKWVPELSHVTGKAIHDPYGRGQADSAAKSGYPKMIVDHKFARDRALTRYKAGIARDKP